MPSAMPSGTARRVRQSRQNIKQDPDSLASSHLPQVCEDTDFDTERNAALSTNSNYAPSSAYIPVGQSFIRNGRSDAPAPSERTSEPEPLLREVRARPNMPAESPTNVEGSFFHTSFQDIGKKLKACNDTLGELQQLGVSHDVQLPELVLVGDQSAGKSSLMSGLANLELPRSEGTCTRCPLHIRVSRNSDWSCRVWLRKDYSYNPPTNRPINVADVTEADPFFPWKKLPVTAVHEFKTMHDKSEIEEVLRWAQVAILNDDKHPGLFVPGSGSIAVNMPMDRAAEETVAKFSPNVVALEIKGPDLPDLSFYDMPGIFQNPADARDGYLVNVVRNLSQAYIMHPSAIIMCSMPMNNDAENSSTFGLTRRLGASNRTIGVLTKADLLNEVKNYEPLLKILKGEAHQTGLGYFITSRLQDRSLEDLKNWEEQLFEDNSSNEVPSAFWPSAFRPFTERCGVERLKAFLSERLGEEFAKSLPNIKQKVKSNLDKTKRQLANLPELPENVELEIQTSLMTFADSARVEMDNFVKRFNKLPASFRECLLEMKPKFTLKDKSDIPVLEISDDDSDAASVVATNGTPTSKRRSNALQATPSKRPRLDTPASSFHGTAPPNGHVKPEETVPVGGLPPPATLVKRQIFPEPFTEFSDIGRGFRTLRQVREEIQSKMKAGMPNRIPDEVYEDLVKEAVEPWNRPMDAFLKQTMRLLQAELDMTLNKALESLKKRFVYQEARKHLKTCLDDHRRETEEALVLLYRDETERLLTFNEEAFTRYERDEKILLTRFRHQMRMHAAGHAQPKTLVPWDSLTEEKRMQDTRRRESEMHKIGLDQFEREVDVVAYVRGYYRLAALRFADSVSQRIICRMIPSIRRKLPYYMEEKLGVRGPDPQSVYERLMAEDETTAVRRETLKGEKLKFEQALASIESLETGAAVAVSSSGGDFDVFSSQERERRDSQATMANGVHVEEV